MFGAFINQELLESLGLIEPSLPKDVLSSKQFSTVIDVLSEGEIEGFPSASGLTQGTTAYNNASLKDVFMNGTQVLQQNASNTSPVDSDFNFQNIAFEPRFGTTNQTHIDGIAAIETETAVGTNVTASTPVTKTITDTSIDAIRITIGFPSIQKFQDDGDIVGTSVDLSIKVIQGDGTTSTSITDTVKGRSKDPYFRDYIVTFSSNIVFPVQIRVERDTADSTSSTLVDAFQWVSFTEIINEQRSYPDVAHIGLRFDAEQFPQIPTRMYKIRGIKVKIPHNATVDTTTGAISYSGTFNGTFKTLKEWTSDPAWILYDLLTNTRYGASLSETTIDQFAFYSASVYNSTLVDDGKGGTEPRFSCNVNITNGNEAFTLINDLCAVMRVMPFYSAGSITISQDRPADPVYQFTLANVLDGGFTYAGTSLKTRHTVVNVGYFDMETQTIDYETVEDTTAIAKYGTVVKNIKSFACTSRGQAARMGRWFLYSEQQSSETCTFTTTLEAGVLVRPGQIIQIADPVRAGIRRGGRLSAVASTTVVTVDNVANTDFAIDSSGNPVGNATLSIILPDGTLETKSISSVNNGEITVSSAYSQTPNINAIWLIENVSVQLTTWRIVNVQENDGLNYTVTALSHNDAKYAFVEDGTSLPTRTVTTLTEIKPAPSGLTSEERIVVLNNRAVSKLIVSWSPVRGVNEYRVQYRFNNGNFVTQTVTRPDIEIFETDIGTFEFRIFSFNAIGKPSTQPAKLIVNTVGKTAVPADVTGLLVEPISDQLLRLRFNQSTDVDVIHGGNVVVRHSNLTNGTGTFTNSVDIIPRLPGSVSETLVPAIDGEYILKFRDDGGRLSSGDASVVVTNPDPLPKLVTLTDREDTDSPPFGGTKVDCFFSDDVNGLVLGSLETLDDVTDFDAIADFDFLGAVDITGGSYDFANILDLGSVHPLRLTRHFVTQGFYPNDLIDKRTANIDTWTDFDAATAFDVNAKLLVATTTAAPGNGSSYQDSDFTGKTFNTFANGTHVGRGFKFRCEMDSDDPAQSIEIDQLGYTAELDRRTEQESNLSSGTSASGLAVTFDHAFFTGASGTDIAAGSQLPSIGITANDLAASETFVVSNISGTGFTIKFIDGSSNAVNKTFSYTAVGFGRGS